jgi:hypothetical protein
MNSQTLTEPKLDRPGAGLPFFEWAVARYVIFPYRFATGSKDRAIADFIRESKQVLSLAEPLTPQELSERRLIKRLRGIEDSSRYWSVGMAVEHLIAAGKAARRVILDLSQGGTKLPEFKIADFKPSPESDLSTLLSRFEKMSDDFVRDMTVAKVDAFPQATYPHPWFGPLNAYQWLSFVAPHQTIHRQQIEAIISLLRK